MNRFANIESIEELIGQTIGAGSACWVYVGGERLFDSDEASKLTDEAIERVRELLAGRKGYWGRNPDIHDRDGHRIAP